MMKNVSLLLAAMIIVGALSFAGCCGGGAEVKTQTYSKTLGRELMDLQDSYKKGIITEKEYAEVKKQLLEQRTK
jgi:hypothetical protein